MTKLWKRLIVLLGLSGAIGGGVILYQQGTTGAPAATCAPVERREVAKKNSDESSSLPENGGKLFNALKKHKKDKNDASANDVFISAQQRKNAFVKAMREDPSLAAAYLIVQNADRADVDAVAGNCVEAEAEIQGQVTTAHIDYTDGQSADEAFMTTDDGERVFIHVNGGLGRLLQEDFSGKKIKIHGWKLDDDILVEGEDAASITIGKLESRPALIPEALAIPNPANVGLNRAVFALSNFTDYKNTTLTVTAAQSIASTLVHNFFAEASYQKADLQSDVRGWHDLPMTSTVKFYDYSATAPDGIYAFVANAAAAVDPSVNLTNYRHMVVYAPWAFNGYGGLELSNWQIKTADSPTGTWNMQVELVWDDRKTPTNFGGQTMLHEIGHGFGALHDDLMACNIGSPAVPLGGGPCLTMSYGNPYSAMGNTNGGHQSALNKALNMGWLTAPNLVEVTTAGRYKIEPFETATTGIKALQWKRSLPGVYPNLGDSFFIEYRQSIGFDANLTYITSGPLPGVYTGALITRRDLYGVFTLLDPVVVDMTPSYDPAAPITDALYRNSLTLPVGATFIDPATQFKITVISADATGLTADVVPGTTDSIAPTVQITDPTLSSVAQSCYDPNPPPPTVVSGKVVFKSMASDDIGIANVAYYSGGYEYQGSRSATAPYQWLWDTTHHPNGWIAVRARTYDYVGNVKESCQINFTIDNPVDIVPPVSVLTRPASGSFFVGQLIYFEGNVTDDHGIKKLELWKDNDTAPFDVWDYGRGSVQGDYATEQTYKTALTIANITGLGQGSHNVRLRSYDFTGNFADSKPITYTQGSSTQLYGIAPDVVITSPNDGATVRSTTIITASVTDFRTPAVPITATFKVDNLTICTDATIPFSCAWNTASATNGSHKITVVGSDNTGNSSPASITVTVSNSTDPPPIPTDTIPPSVPTGLIATSVTSAQVNLSWNASSDNVGVTGYKISRNGSQIAITPITSYASAGLTPSTTYTFTISAYDLVGNTSGQSPLIVTTLATPPPQPISVTLVNYGVAAKTGNSAQVTFSTNILSVGTVKYGRSASALTGTATDGMIGINHKLLLQGLQPRTRYYYQIEVKSTDGTSGDQSGTQNFRTANR